MSYPRKESASEAPKKYWTGEEAKTKIAAFCAYQERCQKEVREKLHERGLYGDKAEDLIADMISEGFLNEERFAKAFVRGKFRLKKWGRNKIMQDLKFRHISPNCIKYGFREIEDEEYVETLRELAEKKWRSLPEKDPFKKKHKVYQYLIGRGYERDLIQEAISSIQEGE
jgi:regulatory protein